MRGREPNRTLSLRQRRTATSAPEGAKARALSLKSKADCAIRGHAVATIMDDLIRALPKLLRAAGEAEEVCEAAAMVAWRRAAGQALRGQAVPFRLYRKTLVVAVSDTTWQKQLEAISGQLLFRINSILGQAVVTY